MMTTQTHKRKPEFDIQKKDDNKSRKLKELIQQQPILFPLRIMFHTYKDKRLYIATLQENYIPRIEPLVYVYPHYGLNSSFAISTCGTRLRVEYNDWGHSIHYVDMTTGLELLLVEKEFSPFETSSINTIRTRLRLEDEATRPPGPRFAMGYNGPRKTYPTPEGLTLVSAGTNLSAEFNGIKVTDMSCFSQVQFIPNTVSDMMQAMEIINAALLNKMVPDLVSIICLFLKHY